MTDITVVMDAVSRWAAPQNSMPIPINSVSRGSDVWEAFTGGSDGAGGLPVPSETTANTIAAASACVKVLAGAVSVLPMNVYSRKRGGEREQMYDDPLWWMLNEQFHPRWSAAAGWEYLMRSRLFHGDAFAVIERNLAGDVTGLKPVHPRNVQVYETPNDRLVYAVYPTNTAMPQSVMVYDQDDFLHVTGDGFDGLRTPSPLRYELRMVGATALATQEYTARFFANGARPDYIIKAEGATNLSDEQFNRIKEQVAENHQGLSQSRRPMVLEGGLTFQTVSMPLEDVELLGIRKFQVEEIARVFGVPPFMIGHNEKTTSFGSGIEEMGIGFVRYTLRRHLHAFTNEINRKFYKTNMIYTEFDTTDLERASTKSLYEGYKIALGGQGAPGWMAQNDVRRKEKLQPIAGGDVVNDGSQGATPPQGADNEA